jgi:hAT family C-terminal dimerisation region
VDSQFTAYFISATKERDCNSFCFKQIQKGNKTSLHYWLADGVTSPDLQSIRIKLFSVAMSSVASERNFSKMGFIHSNLRNCLSPESIQNLVFVKTNYYSFAQFQYADEEERSDSENEQSALE